MCFYPQSIFHIFCSSLCKIHYKKSARIFSGHFLFFGKSGQGRPHLPAELIKLHTGECCRSLRSTRSAFFVHVFPKWQTARQSSMSLHICTKSHHVTRAAVYEQLKRQGSSISQTPSFNPYNLPPPPPHPPKHTQLIMFGPSPFEPHHNLFSVILKHFRLISQMPLEWCPALSLPHAVLCGVISLLAVSW